MARVYRRNDCVDKGPEPVEDCHARAHRARESLRLAASPLAATTTKNPFVSLREIRRETQQADDLRERNDRSEPDADEVGRA